MGVQEDLKEARALGMAMEAVEKSIALDQITSMILKTEDPVKKLAVVALLNEKLRTEVFATNPEAVEEIDAMVKFTEPILKSSFAEFLEENKSDKH